MRLVIRLLINAAALWVTAEILPDMSIEDGFGNLLLAALIFGLVNTFIRPIARLLTLPISLATLGLFTVVVNALMVMLTGFLVDVLSLDGGFVNQLLTAIVASILISIVSTALSWLLPDRD
jgi:putative membrane protein